MGAGGRMDNGGEKGRDGDGSKAFNAAGIILDRRNRIFRIQIALPV
jgi:hypothetical protein